ncbi:MAG: hypothetical protein ACOC8E_01745 [Planctomycetota bacterium]
MKARANGRIGGALAVQLVILGSMLVMAVAVVVPVVRGRKLGTERARALGDLRRLAADITTYHKDTGTWPGGANLAVTDGDPPAGEAHAYGDQSEPIHISKFLTINQADVDGWHGPYMSMSRSDPWGHRYVVVLEGLQSREPPYAWALSAGPDGILETGPSDDEVRGDDLGLRLR